MRRQLELAAEAERRLSDPPISPAKAHHAQRKAALEAKAAATEARRARARERKRNLVSEKKQT